MCAHNKCTLILLHRRVCILKYPIRIDKIDAMHVSVCVCVHTHLEFHTDRQTDRERKRDASCSVIYIFKMHESITEMHMYQWNCLLSVSVFVYWEAAFESSMLWIRNAILYNSIQLGVLFDGRGRANATDEIYLISLQTLFSLSLSIDFIINLSSARIGYIHNNVGDQGGHLQCSCFLSFHSHPYSSPSIPRNSVFAPHPLQFNHLLTCVRFNSINTLVI